MSKVEAGPLRHVELSIWDDEHLSKVIVSRVGGKFEFSVDRLEGCDHRPKLCFVLSIESARLLHEFIHDISESKNNEG